MPRKGWGLRAHPDGRKGVWLATVSLGKDPVTGKYRRRSTTITARTKTEADKLAETWANRQRRSHAGATVEHLVADYLEWNQATEKLRPDTWTRYEQKLRAYVVPYLGQRPLADLDTVAMAEWYDWLTRDARLTRAHRAGEPLSANTINQTIRIVRAVFRWARRNGKITDVEFLAPLIQITPPAAPQPDRNATARFLADAMTQGVSWFTMLWLAGSAGLARSELAGLQTGDIDLEHRRLHVRRSIAQTGRAIQAPKTARRARTVALDPMAVELLERLLTERVADHRLVVGMPHARLPGDAWLFPSPRDPTKPWFVDSITTKITRDRRRLGIADSEVWLHGLRHIAATLGADAGVSPKVLADQLGHTNSTAVTERFYIGALDASQHAAADQIGTELGRLVAESSSARSSEGSPIS